VQAPSLTGCDLGGAGVLVTRAAHQAEPLCRLIESRGGRPVRFPAMEILGPRDPAEARHRLAALDHYDVLVFVSPNAVSYALDLLGPGLVPTARRPLLAAVGEATARALARHGLVVGLLPGSGRYDSEGLLAARALQEMAGRRVLIVRGEGGRELLATELRRRGAAVDYAEVYRRALPQLDPTPLLAAWDQDVQVVLATSADVLGNLERLLANGLGRLRATPLLVVSDRIAQVARGLGYGRIIRADRAGDDAVIAALCRWAAER
jgi:uroporphyrinogen-III synthase